MSDVSPRTPHPRTLQFAERDAARTVFARILVVLDPTASTHACIEKAARLARSFGSVLELYVCDAELDPPQHLALLERLAAPLRAQGLLVETCAEKHFPLEEGIGHHIIRSHPDLVIKDSHRHALTTRAGVSHTDWSLLSQAAVPLLLVRPQSWSPRSQILVALDPCRPADHPAALDMALLEIANGLGNALVGAVQLLHVVGTPPHLPGEPVAAETRREWEEKSQQALHRIASQAGVDAAAVHCVAGAPVRGIVGYASAHRPDILIMGSSGRRRWAHTAAGNTATAVLEQVDCDLLVCKAPGFISPLLVTED